MIAEQAILCGSSGSLVGIVSEPATRESGADHLPAVLLLNSGIIHRVGPNRLYVTLCRLLSGRGWTSLRFDLSGLGDSATRGDKLRFEESSVQETREAMDYLAETRGYDRFVLAGICTGAVVSYYTALADPRVVGALLINAQGLLDASDQAARSYIAKQKAARHYVGNSIYSYKSWLRLFSGRVDYRELFSVLRSKLTRERIEKVSKSPEAEKVQRGFRALVDRGMELFLLYSEGDPGVDELDVVLGDDQDAFRTRVNVTFRVVERSDHMFTALAKQEEFLRLTGDWLQSLSARVAVKAVNEPTVDAGMR